MVLRPVGAHHDGGGGAVWSGPAAFAEAGVTPADIKYASIYDSFTITVLMQLEDLGFCAKGEGKDFVSGGRIAPGGAFPMNTSGGGLSYTHPGMFGIFLLIEAVRQLRGECGERQVPGATAVQYVCASPIVSSIIYGSEAR